MTCAFAGNTVEPPIIYLQNLMLVERDTPWYEQRLPVVEDRIRGRLRELPFALAMPSGSIGYSVAVTY